MGGVPLVFPPAIRRSPPFTFLCFFAKTHCETADRLWLDAVRELSNLFRPSARSKGDFMINELNIRVAYDG